MTLIALPETHEAGRPIDTQAAEQAAAQLLLALGADLSDESLRETPRRMAAAYSELLTPQPFRPTTFPNDGGYDELIVARSIPFHSLCMHHLLPFHGVAHVGYLPGERILGLSKLARVVELFARDLQIQERLTVQIAGWLREHLAPRASASCSRPSTCACRSAACRSSARVPSHPPSTGSSATTTAPARSSWR
jgi:GTP cyclohydrolase I